MTLHITSSLPFGGFSGSSGKGSNHRIMRSWWKLLKDERDGNGKTGDDFTWFYHQRRRKTKKALRRQKYSDSLCDWVYSVLCAHNLKLYPAFPNHLTGRPDSSSVFTESNDLAPPSQKSMQRLNESVAEFERYTRNRPIKKSRQRIGKRQMVRS